jgi:hypothetical protein
MEYIRHRDYSRATFELRPHSVTRAGVVPKLRKRSYASGANKFHSKPAAHEKYLEVFPQVA